MAKHGLVGRAGVNGAGTVPDDFEGLGSKHGCVQDYTLLLGDACVSVEFSVGAFQ